MHPVNRLWIVLLLIVVALAGCGRDEAQGGEEGAAKAPRPPLRILTLAEEPGAPGPEGVELARAYALSVGREPRRVAVDSPAELIPALLAGKGELIAAELTATERRRQKVAFTVPVAYAREVVVTRAGEGLEGRQDLGGRRPAVKRGTSYRGTLERIRGLRFQPEFEIVEVPGEISPQGLLDRVAAGEYDLTVLDGHTAEALLAGRDDLEVAFALSKVRPVAWAVRPGERELLRGLNAFLGEHHLLPETPLEHRGDLAAIRERGVLRMATRNSAVSYFLWRGEFLGFEYELAKRLAGQLGVRLEVVVPPGSDQLLQWVREGRADFAAASLAITEARSERGIAFSRPYHEVSELLVTRADDAAPRSPRDLAGRTVVVRRSSSYWGTLERLRKERGIDFALQPAAETLETEEIIARVAAGEYDLTVADSHIVDIELTWRDDIRSAFALGEPRPHGWALREANRGLREAVDAFLEKEYRGTFYNLTYRKYFEDPKRILEHVESRVDGGAALSPYDEPARRYADRYGFDWRLIVAQMFQESRFDPAAKSWAGALGLMQVLPRTAKELGLTKLRDPETGLHAGVKYLHWLMRRFEPELEVAERTWFALAAYNAGVGHVRDARRLAKRKGWDPNRWFDNVERAVLLLANKEYARKARHGYVRGREPVRYVRQIHERFKGYVALTPEPSVAEAVEG